MCGKVQGEDEANCFRNLEDKQQFKWVAWFPPAWGIDNEREEGNDL